MSSMPERRGTQALEAWARRVTSGYEGVTVTNMSTAWRDGLAFCALIHHFRPDLIEFSTLKPENILENNSLAFRVAEQQLGIPALLDAEDMVAHPVPDRLSILTYVSQYYRAFSALGLLSGGKGGRDRSSTGPPAATTPASSPQTSPHPSPVGCPPSSSPSPVASRTPKANKTDTRTDKVLGRGVGRREVCASCGLPVYLAERMVVGAPGQLMHRTCFRCARCSAQLALASYYQTERGQYCCETCPDEERPPAPPSPPPLSHTDTDDDSSTEEDADSEEESEAPRLPDTPAPTPSPTPPRPRTVFLTQTLVAAPEQPPQEPPKQPPDKPRQPSAFTTVSPALFGSVGGAGRVREHSPEPAPHPRSIKSLKTDPSEAEAGQRIGAHSPLHSNAHRDTPSRSRSTPSTASSIVARRLRMFQEMSHSKVEKRRQGEPAEKPYIPSITISLETLDRGGKEHSTSVSAASTSTTAAQNPLEKEVGEEVNAESQTSTLTQSHKSHIDRDQVVSEAETMSQRKEAVVEKSQREEGREPEESHEHVDELQQEGDQSVALSQSYSAEVVSQSDSKSSESHTGGKSGGVSPRADRGSPVVTSREPHSGSQQYPDDLNPFGSEDEDDEDTASAPQTSLKDSSPHTTAEPPPEDTKAHSTATGDVQDSLGRRLIRPNLNPFESDEDEEEEEEEEEVVPRGVAPPREEGKRNLNPFWSDDDEDDDTVRGRTGTSAKAGKVRPPRPPPPTLQRNRSPSTLSTASSTSTTPRKKVIAPPLPPSPQLSLTSSPGGSVALRKKARRAPAPPQHPHSEQDTRSIDTASSGGGDREDPDEVLNWKLQKDLKNHSNKLNGTLQPPPKPSRSPQLQQLPAPHAVSEPTDTRTRSLSKSEAGEWKRKKGPAPPRPVPQKRSLKKLPMKVIQQELHDIDIKQTELERQGVLLETQIRKRTEVSAPPSPQDETAPPSSPPSSLNSIEVEDMILQLFELVNEKNELFRRQTELMYLKREKRLEEEHVELEYQIRCLMLKPPGERTAEDAEQEEELIGRLVKVVEQRDEIINCLELDRLREAQEDESIATHMMQYQEKHIDGMENGSKGHTEPVKKKRALKLPRKKKKKKEKSGGAAKADADKDVDESETPVDPKKKKKKKKWLF